MQHRGDTYAAAARPPGALGTPGSRQTGVRADVTRRRYGVRVNRARSYDPDMVDRTTARREEAGMRRPRSAKLALLGCAPM